MVETFSQYTAGGYFNFCTGSSFFNETENETLKVFMQNRQNEIQNTGFEYNVESVVIYYRVLIIFVH